ncbi:MAG: phosphoribosylformylglycinamidine synthase subunit PurL [Planctomycetes bacterium]|nr:phosphoribosylformylglycinamidine synthase subunit PurL [Planctomycetota bacterium]
MVDVRGSSLLRRVAAEAGAAPTAVRSAQIYLVEGDLNPSEVEVIGGQLLADPVTQCSFAGSSAIPKAGCTIEVHPLPGVTDPAAESVEIAVERLIGKAVRVRTGDRWDFDGVDEARGRQVAEKFLANSVVQAVHAKPYRPDHFPAGSSRPVVAQDIPLRDLSDGDLDRLSRSGHLFLDLEEMKAIQAHYRTLGREPREIELETLAQTWSEHCVHKTLKSRVRYRESSLIAGTPSLLPRAARMAGHTADGADSMVVDNLLKHTVAAATHAMMDASKPGAIDWCLSVFVDNAGVIAFDEKHALCMKVETHNHPSAIEPYGGAATGIGGCIRDVMGTGLAAKPIACTDVFCVAPPEAKVPRGCLPPDRVLRQVVAGVRDYGNRMGIPTVNGGVWFDPRYVGNPLVYCGVVGLLPRDLVRGQVEAGDRIIALGGRTGRDGIHGATFSSAELTDSHADEFGHAVQIGNAITQKKTLDAILAARDAAKRPLFHAITDCGAGGFSSAVGEMGKSIGAEVHLDHAPLKYDGLTPTEVWISEAQERMVLAVPAANLASLQRLCDDHGVLLCDLGSFGTPDGELILMWKGEEMGRLSMEFLEEGLPKPVREAVWDGAWHQRYEPAAAHALKHGAGLAESLGALLAHGNIASKAWIIRQYDHEVQGTSVIKPLVGKRGAPGDAAVLQPLPDSPRGVAIANGLATGLAADPYLMTLAAIDECVRNLVCVGTDPEKIAILDNFCWPSCKDPRHMGSLVRASEACLDGALAYRTPFISGKDSLNNQFQTEEGETIHIPPTMLVSGLGIVQRVDRAVTMDAKKAGNKLILVGVTDARMGGSHRCMLGDVAGANLELPVVDLEKGPRIARAVAACIASGRVASAHDASEGGLLVASAEMAFGGDLGLTLDLDAVPCATTVPLEARAFAETPSRYLLEVAPEDVAAISKLLGTLVHAVVGEFDSSGGLRAGGESISVKSLRDSWESAGKSWST